MGQHILLVEDELLIRMWLADELSKAGFDVLEAEDGDRATIVLDQTPALDLLITDIQMPGRTDGNVVATRAKQRWPGLPVIYVSGRPSSLKNEIGLCDAFLAKPFTAAAILTTAQRLLDARCNQRDIAARTEQVCSEPNRNVTLTTD
ncbi:MAG: response regulator [Rhodopila sp.]|jgi:DNA-binding response OmpR family regulator